MSPVDNRQGNPNLDERGELPIRAGEERLSSPVARKGMFGARTSGDTSGYGGLVVRRSVPLGDERPFTDPDDPRTASFDEVADNLEHALKEDGLALTDAVERVVVHHGEMTLHVRREHLGAVARRLRDDPALRYELCLGVAGVHYPHDTGRELHAVYEMRSITHNRELRLEVSCPDSDPHIPSIVDVYPTNNWHEREAWDFFGIIFDGHPALTRIQMPDDWRGHPQRKDYPLGGIPVEYRGAKIPPPDERRSYA
ncbi:NADH-quinone oxidoreductase subunit C [Marinitenerispora sediminis]|uniref:NADH-quinone oxidoreductase subunit C n=1 Tax=Marinitenerispora sediminis TaxID=1931232 RepID=A0A368TDI8_9ACTN|nr:NADH-quinone oxidoreductase subunit C [Marinitenerispora sediminis]RCV52849.1 NADH-quinone oxidoreductase subunit C [Marinitenerispora sediminis]RCV60024.1 NADH-quinone oxidoreductase subunit C [Marinitenerispora sediminis]RCV61931.1 NADH-quinone oxidoreductase subunit C [Marinitenerispora sediminis]